MPNKSDFLKELTQSNLLDCIPCAVFLKDANGKFLGCNTFLANLAGYPDGASVVGKTDYEMPWADESINYAAIDQTVITSKEPIERTETIQLAKKKIIAKTIKTPLYLNGKITGLIGTFVDITDLVELKIQAESANRAKTAFLANMSHDVKTPMTGVVSVADIIVNDENSPAKDRQLAKMIFDSGRQVLALFDNCIELSKLEMLEFMSNEEVFSLEKLLQEIQVLFIPSAKSKALDLTLTYDAKIPKALYGQRASIYRILLNLISNALKFMQAGGVVVRAFLAEGIDEKNVRIGLEITDTGMGIPDDLQVIIFEKLRRLTPSYEGKIEGHGIGLYIVDQYVKRMKGEIQVESKVGVGSTFTVFLPLTVVENISPDVQVTTKATLPQSTVAPSNISTFSEKEENALPDNAPRILVVEDAPMIQYVTKVLLNDAGFHVDIAGTGAEAIAAFVTGKYDLIYMDIGLPDIDGYAVTQAIREKEKHLGVAAIPIIALTGHGAVDVQAFCGRAGMQGVLSKPINGEQAKGVWARYGKGEPVYIDGLYIIESMSVQKIGAQVIDKTATAALLGSEKKAQEMLDLLAKELQGRFLPNTEALIKTANYKALHHQLHAMLGTLCYVKTPLLHQAVLKLDHAIKNNSPDIEEAYSYVQEQVRCFLESYRKMKITA